VVHDSFGTHACDIEQLGIILRETFVDLYGNTNVLETFKQEQKLELPDLPAFGTLDINEVLDSEFFFS